MPGLLVADDMPIVRATVAKIVTDENLALSPVAEACNGEEAVSLARQMRPDIVLMDIKMPGMDGFEAASTIHSEQPDTKIVMLSAYDEYSFVRRAFKLGVIDYLLKPIRPTELLSFLMELQTQIRRELKQNPEQNEKIKIPSDSQDSVQQALNYIRQNQCQADMTFQDVANAVHMSPSHLSTLLKAKTEMSYVKYLRSLRIAHASQLLTTTNLTIETIAETVGYTAVSNFYRLFQRDKGMTPAAFRREQHWKPIEE